MKGQEAKQHRDKNIEHDPGVIVSLYRRYFEKEAINFQSSRVRNYMVAFHEGHWSESWRFYFQAILVCTTANQYLNFQECTLSSMSVSFLVTCCNFIPVDGF